MMCENCSKANNWVEMQSKVINEIKGTGYSRLIELSCPECDFKFMKVA